LNLIRRIGEAGSFDNSLRIDVSKIGPTAGATHRISMPDHSADRHLSAPRPSDHFLGFPAKSRIH
jgi:hypothetical protein